MPVPHSVACDLQEDLVKCRFCQIYVGDYESVFGYCLYYCRESVGFAKLNPVCFPFFFNFIDTLDCQQCLGNIGAAR